MAPEDAGPGGIGEVARPLTDHQGRARPVADITDGDPAVRVEYAGAPDLRLRGVHPARRGDVLAGRARDTSRIVPQANRPLAAPGARAEKHRNPDLPPGPVFKQANRTGA